MLALNLKVIKAPPSAEKIYKNIVFGTAVGLTRTAKEAQSAEQDELAQKFTLRNTWWKQNTPVGIKVKPATKDDLTAQVYTAAKFLPIHEEGGVKTPFHNFIAVPTRFAQPNKGRIIPVAMRPRALIDSGKAAIVVNERGTRILYAHLGPTKGWLPMYIMVPKATEKRRDFFYPPIRQAVERRLQANISAEIDKALANIK